MLCIFEFICRIMAMRVGHRYRPRSGSYVLYDDTDVNDEEIVQENANVSLSLKKVSKSCFFIKSKYA